MFSAIGAHAVTWTGSPSSAISNSAAMTVAGSLGLNAVDATGRRLWIAGGLGLAATALVGSLLVGADPDVSRAWFSLIGPLASGLVFFGGGLYLTNRA